MSAMVGRTNKNKTKIFGQETSTTNHSELEGVLFVFCFRGWDEGGGGGLLHNTLPWSILK